MLFKRKSIYPHVFAGAICFLFVLCRYSGFLMETCSPWSPCLYCFFVWVFFQLLWFTSKHVYNRGLSSLYLSLFWQFSKCSCSVCKNVLGLCFSCSDYLFWRFQNFLTSLLKLERYHSLWWSFFVLSPKQNALKSPSVKPKKKLNYPFFWVVNLRWSGFRFCHYEPYCFLAVFCLRCYPGAVQLQTFARQLLQSLFWYQ